VYVRLWLRVRCALITENQTIGDVLDGLKELGVEARVDRLTAIGGKGILTDRQEDVIRIALESGYFDFPRRIDSSKLADKLGISVSTLSEILRAAERRIFSEYLRA
jgi:predicted DNA binding protein